MLEDVGIIFDVDGYEITSGSYSEFLVKEMAFVSVGLNMSWAGYLQVGDKQNLSKWNQRRVDWVYYNIHHLPFEDIPHDLPQNEKYNIVKYFCEMAKENNKLIAYKGGHYEKDLIAAVGYGYLSVNLELFQCPKFVDILNSFDEPTKHQFITQYTCNRHDDLGSFSNIHCPQLEARCFEKFILDHQKKIVSYYNDHVIQ